jgi:hypothetical protein
MAANTTKLHQYAIEDLLKVIDQARYNSLRETFPPMGVSRSVGAISLAIADNHPGLGSELFHGAQC